MKTLLQCLTAFLWTASLWTSGAASAAGPATLSPGSLEPPGSLERSETLAPSRCPTFSWGSDPDDRDFELVIYRLDEVNGEAAERVASQEISGVAFSWTPPDCLTPGVYAWAIRARTSEDREWSPPRFFAVEPERTREELEAALALVSRFLAASPNPSGGDPERPSPHPDPSATRRATTPHMSPETPSGAATVAIRGHNTDLSGNAVGVEALSASSAGAGLLAANQAGGPDLRLDSQGGIDTELTEAGIVRSSPLPQSFDIGNPDGDLVLTIDGMTAVTTATDQDTQYSSGNQLSLNGTTFDVVEGPGSGLDADTVDGLHATSFQYSAGTGIDIDTSNQISNTGDTNAGDDLTTSTLFAGEISGPYNALALSASLAFADGDLLDLSAINGTSGNEGLILPQANNISASTHEGQISWDSDDDRLYVGTGSTAMAVRPTVNISTSAGTGSVYTHCLAGSPVGGGCSGVSGDTLRVSCPAVDAPNCSAILPTGWLCVLNNGGAVTAYVICLQ